MRDVGTSHSPFWNHTGIPFLSYVNQKLIQKSTKHCRVVQKGLKTETEILHLGLV